MKIIILMLLSTFAVLSAERIVDEKTINEWGYKTVSLEKSQFIKKMEKINKTGPAYYPRFFISKECFQSPEEANSKIQEIENLQKTDVRHRDFDYRMGFVNQSCLFILNTDSMLFKLDYQPQIFELLKNHVLSNKSL